ncbi:L,D-transpeptidase, partial [Bifidobacterium longum]|uniref:L,D-transpeptidase n=1 Tax=Bifidobacterium longum TaxID=216816 RepID=UPI0013F48940
GRSGVATITRTRQEPNKLGSPASHGCVRLTVPDVKWLYEQLPQGTTVHIY